MFRDRLLAHGQERYAFDRLLAVGRGALGVDETLSRGFALVRDQGGAVVRTAAALGPGARITVRFVDGEVAARVERAP